MQFDTQKRTSSYDMIARRILCKIFERSNSMRGSLNLIGAVSVLKTDIKGGRLPHFVREKKVGLQQLFLPYIKGVRSKKMSLNQNEPIVKV